MLQSAPTGISWKTIPGSGASAQQQQAEQLNICQRATAMVNEYCNVPLRATIDSETLTGPGDFRVVLRHNGVTRLLLSRPPVVSVLSGQVSSATQFPANWQPIAGNQFKVEKPLIGVYGSTAPDSSGAGGQAVLMAPGILSWGGGRHSTDIQVTYLNGWPHGSLTASALAGATSLAVDDITGWNGATGTVYDTVGQEAVSVTAVTPNTTGALSGPGTLTLASPLGNAHQSGVLVTCLPNSVIWATILFAVTEALVRGATAISPQGMSGSMHGGKESADLAGEAELMIHPYKRVL